MSLSVHQRITSVKEQKIGRATRVLCYWSHLNRKWMQIVLFSTEDKNQMVSSWCFFVWVKLYKSISRLKREQFLNCSSWVWRCYRCQIGGLFFKSENKRVCKNLWPNQPDVSCVLLSIHDFAFCSPVTTLSFQSFLSGRDFPNTAHQKSVPSMPCVHTCGLYWRRNNVAVHDPWAGTFHCVTPRRPPTQQ